MDQVETLIQVRFLGGFYPEIQVWRIVIELIRAVAMVYKKFTSWFSFLLKSLWVTTQAAQVLNPFNLQFQKIS